MAVGALHGGALQNAFADAGDDCQWLAAAAVAGRGGRRHSWSGRWSALAAARLRGPYLAGVTLAVAVVVPALTVTFDDCSTAIRGCRWRCEPPPAGARRRLPGRAVAGWLALVGRAARPAAAGQPGPQPVRPDLRAVRDDEVAARLAGIHVARTQVLAFVVSAACAGLGGGAVRRAGAERLARRVLADAVAVPADGRRDRRPGQPDRRGVGRGPAGRPARTSPSRRPSARPLPRGRAAAARATCRWPSSASC